MKTALLLIAHGSRNTEANDDLFALTEDLRKTGRYAIVEASFLELAEPTIEMAAARCLEQGAGRIVLVPYFLSAGVHVKRDLQNHRAALAKDYSAVDFALAEPLGRHELLREIVLQRANEASDQNFKAS